jgi:hypothetical protein
MTRIENVQYLPAEAMLVICSRERLDLRCVGRDVRLGAGGRNVKGFVGMSGRAIAKLVILVTSRIA